MWGSLEKIHLQRLLRQEVLQLMDLPAKVYGDTGAAHPFPSEQSL
jgi:hypothetical protein